MFNYLIKYIIIIGGVVVGIIALLIVVFIFVGSNSEKLVCKSTEGNITLMYSDKELVGYTSVGTITFDMDVANTVVKEVGIKSYIEQFKVWFSDNTDGTCE
ncbi:MAG: hypothetical protein PHR55_01485 [Bacilli bacterium]|nr:hypothetical protein [Bacilli bacterium]